MIKLAALAVAAASLVACTGDATDSTESTQDQTTVSNVDRKGVEIVTGDLQKFGDLSERLDLQPDLELEQPVDSTPVAAENSK